MNDTALDAKKRQLVADIEELNARQERKRKSAAMMYTLVIVLGFALSIAAVVLGFIGIERSEILSILVILLAVPAGLESAFKFGEKRDFYRVLVSESYNLKTTLNYSVSTEKEFKIIVNKFKDLVAYAAKSLPRGQGMQAVKTLYEDLDRRGIVKVSPDLLAKP